MSHRAVAVVFLGLTFAIVASPAFAQVPSDSHSRFGASASPTHSSSPQLPGSIKGSIQTLDGRSIADARIELKELPTGTVLFTTFSQANGSFELYNIPLGTYEVTARSGLSEARERVDVLPGIAFVSLQISGPVSDPSTGATVSVAAMKVPRKARKEFDKAEKAFNENKFDDAKERVNKALQLYPNFAQALTLRGILLLNDNQPDEGQADLQNALKFDPSYSLAYFAMGAALNHVGKYDDALRILDRGLAISPDTWQGHFESARASLGKEDFASALKSVTRAQQLVKEDYPPVSLVKAHALLGLKQYKTAIAELEGYLFRQPNSPNSEGARKTLDRAKAFVANGSVTAGAR